MKKINEKGPIKAFQKPYLHFTSGLRAGEKVWIVADSWIIGRDDSADLQLDSRVVSRRHAELLKQGGYWFVRDLGSKNGVIRNRVRIQPGELVPLYDGDEVQIGNASVFEFHDPESTVHEANLRLRKPGLWLDDLNREVHIQDRRVDPPLSPQQYALLALLVSRRGGVVTNLMIADVLWPEAAGGVEDAAIDNAISRLRARLAEVDGGHEYIETVRGVGRRFVQRGE